MHLATTSLAAVTLLLSASAQTTVSLSAVQDNTIWDVDPTCCSNGAGTHAYVGTNGNGNAMRMLVQFDVAGALPAGATILSAELHIVCLQTNAGPIDVDLHRVTDSWGEGSSFAPGGQGAGTGSQPGDANWITRHFGSGPDWTTPGGDFDPTPSSSTSIDAAGPYVFLSNAAMEGVVQNWLDLTVENHGWILVGEEPTGQTTGKRLASREYGPEGPRLRVTFTHPGAFAVPFGTACDSSGALPVLALDAATGTGLPTIGQPMRLQFTAGGTPTTGTALSLGTAQLIPWVELPPPLGCALRIDQVVWTGANDPQDGRTLQIPNNQSLSGVELYWQAFGVAQPFELVSTNGLLTKLGV